jgi:hypothetical protein
MRSYSVLKDRLSRESGIVGISGARSRPTSFSSKISGVDWEGKDPETRYSFSYESVDFDFLETMKIELIEGRSFSEERPADLLSAILINEEAKILIGGQSVVGNRFSGMGIDGHIIGVMKNFHFLSVRDQIGPLFLYLDPDNIHYAIVRFGPGDPVRAVNLLQSIWSETFPAYPFEYAFIDDDFAVEFRNDQRTRDILRIATMITIFIACLGLFGLAAFMAEKRTKEIGIRKALGASVGGISVMLTKEFVKWVFIANLIALPIAYTLMRQWLKDYAYPIRIEWHLLFAAMIASIIIAVITVSYQSVRLALSNPIDSLKYE